jgi:hypothetical protein
MKIVKEAGVLIVGSEWFMMLSNDRAEFQRAAHQNYPIWRSFNANNTPTMTVSPPRFPQKNKTWIAGAILGL